MYMSCFSFTSFALPSRMSEIAVFLDKIMARMGYEPAALAAVSSALEERGIKAVSPTPTRGRN